MKFTASCYCGWQEEKHGSAGAAGRMVLRAAFKHRREGAHGKYLQRLEAKDEKQRLKPRVTGRRDRLIAHP